MDKVLKEREETATFRVAFGDNKAEAKEESLKIASEMGKDDIKSLLSAVKKLMNYTKKLGVEMLDMPECVKKYIPDDLAAAGRSNVGPSKKRKKAAAEPKSVSTSATKSKPAAAAAAVKDPTATKVMSRKERMMLKAKGKMENAEKSKGGSLSVVGTPAAAKQKQKMSKSEEEVTNADDEGEIDAIECEGDETRAGGQFVEVGAAELGASAADRKDLDEYHRLLEEERDGTMVDDEIVASEHEEDEKSGDQKVQEKARLEANIKVEKDIADAEAVASRFDSLAMSIDEEDDAIVDDKKGHESQSAAVELVSTDVKKNLEAKIDKQAKNSFMDLVRKRKAERSISKNSGSAATKAQPAKKKKKEAKKADEDDLMPETIAQRLLPKSMVDGLFANVDTWAKETKAHIKRKCTLKSIKDYAIAGINRVVGNVTLLVVSGKTMSALMQQAKEVVKAVDGKWDRESMAKLRDANGSFWNFANDNGTQPHLIFSTIDENDRCKGLRLIDAAYTSYFLENNPVPKWFEEQAYQNQVFAHIMTNCGKVVSESFKVTESVFKHASANSNVWRCSVTGRRVKLGDQVRCILAARDPLTTDEEAQEFNSRLVQYNSMVGEGIITLDDFKRSDYNTSEMQHSLLAFFIIETGKSMDSHKSPVSKKSVDKPAAAKVVPKVDKKVAAEATKKELLTSMAQSSASGGSQASKKRKAGGESNVTAAAAAADAVASTAKPKAKKPKSSSEGGGEAAAAAAATSCSKAVPKDLFSMQQDGELFDVDYNHACAMDSGVKYTVKPKVKSRDFVAHQSQSSSRIAPGAEFLFTNAMQKQMEDGARWMADVFSSGQGFPVADIGNTEMYASDPDVKDAAEHMYSCFKGEVEYHDSATGSVNANTAGSVAYKLNEMLTNITMEDGDLAMEFLDSSGEDGGPRVHPNQIRVVGQWMKMLLCTVMHPFEAQYLTKVSDYMGRRFTSGNKALSKELRKKELPAMRELSSVDYNAQFIRIVMDAFYKGVIVPLSTGELESFDFSSDDSTLISAVGAYTMDEGDSPEGDSVNERVGSLLTEWKQRVSKEKMAERKALEAAYVSVRKQMATWRPDEDIAKSPWTHLFLASFYPYHPLLIK